MAKAKDDFPKPTRTTQPALGLKALRLRLGLTQKVFADRMGVTVLTVKLWESGERSPSKRHQALIATVAQTAQAPASTAPPVTMNETRRILRIGEAVRMMGLKDEGHGLRSDRTIRNALISGALPGWKAPGYRAAIAEWCFYEDDFKRWRTIDRFRKS